jgi:hypothetical protein
VQWGPGTRSDNKHKRSFSAYDWSSIVAEVCVFAPSEDLISISGWQTEYQVKSIVNQTSKLPTELDEDNP